MHKNVLVVKLVYLNKNFLFFFLLKIIFKVYITRNGGCPHMICSKCQCDFCYNCGRRRLGFKFLGSHESRFSPLGCKYNLYPDKPILRHTVRGLVAGAATLAIPVAAVG